jgi:hypothetical protein
MLAGYTAGIPVAPISVAYSLQSQDHAKLKEIAALLRPGLVYVTDTAPFAPALAALDLAALDLGATELVANRNGANLDRVTAFDALAATRAGAEVERACAAAASGANQQLEGDDAVADPTTPTAYAAEAGPGGNSEGTRKNCDGRGPLRLP